MKKLLLICSFLNELTTHFPDLLKDLENQTQNPSTYFESTVRQINKSRVIWTLLSLIMLIPLTFSIIKWVINNLNKSEKKEVTKKRTRIFCCIFLLYILFSTMFFWQYFSYKESAKIISRDSKSLERITSNWLENENSYIQAEESLREKLKTLKNMTIDTSSIKWNLNISNEVMSYLYFQHDFNDNQKIISENHRLERDLDSLSKLKFDFLDSINSTLAIIEKINPTKMIEKLNFVISKINNMETFSRIENIFSLILIIMFSLNCTLVVVYLDHKIKVNCEYLHRLLDYCHFI